MKLPLLKPKTFRASCVIDGKKFVASARVEDGRIPTGASVALSMFLFFNIRGFGDSARKAAEYAGFEVYKTTNKYRVRPIVGRGKK